MESCECSVVVHVVYEISIILYGRFCCMRGGGIFLGAVCDNVAVVFGCSGPINCGARNDGRVY